MVLTALSLGFFAISASGQASNLEGSWNYDERECWTINTTDGSELSPQPEYGVYLYPVENAVITVSGTILNNTGQQNSQLNNCGVLYGVVEVSEVISQTELLTIPQETSNGEGGNSFNFISVIFISLGICLAVIALIGTDEKSYYNTLKITSLGEEKKNRTSEAIFLQGKIVGFLSSNEGLHFSAIAKEFSLGNNQAAYHLSVLEKSQHIWSKRDGRKLRFYTSIIQPAEQKGLPTPTDLPGFESVPGRIMADIESIERDLQKGAKQLDMAQRIGVSQQLISHHLGALERLQWVQRSGRGKRIIIHLTTAGHDTLRRIKHYSSSQAALDETLYGHN